MSCIRGLGKDVALKSELPAMEMRTVVGEAGLWGNTSSILGMSSLSCQFDIQMQGGNRLLEFKGEVCARDADVKSLS